jgi:hypothetical protein
MKSKTLREDRTAAERKSAAVAPRRRRRILRAGFYFTLKNKIVFCKKQFQNMSVFCFVSTEIVEGTLKR